MKIIATIEARLNSKRLPKKHLLKINKKNVIEILIDRLKKIKNIDKIVLATTTNKIDSQLIKIAKKNKIGFYRGSEENVLERVTKAAKKYRADAILQVSGDAPIIDYELAEYEISMFKLNKVDVFTNYWNSFPRGVCHPIIKYSSLLKSLKNARSMDDFEHVTNYIFNNQKKFKILYFLAPKEYFEPKLRFVLDEYDDYEFLKKILKHDLKNIFTTRKLIDLCVRKKIKYVYKKRNLLIQNYLKSHKNKIKIT